MYTARTMWEVHPRLYWRLKVNGKWTWQAVQIVDHEKDMIAELIAEYRILPPSYEVDESE